MITFVDGLTWVCWYQEYIRGSTAKTNKWKTYVRFVTRMKQNFISLTLKDVLIVGWIKQILVFLIDVTLYDSVPFLWWAESNITKVN